MIYAFFQNSKPVNDRNVIVFYHKVYVMIIACHDLGHNYHIYIYIIMHIFVCLIGNMFITGLVMRYKKVANQRNQISILCIQTISWIYWLRWTMLLVCITRASIPPDPFNGLAKLLPATQSINRPPVGIYNVPSSSCYRFATMSHLERSVQA